MKRAFFQKAAKRSAGALCIAVCLWCAGSAFQSWAAEKGADALLFAAGLRAEPVSAAPPRESPPPASSREPEREEETDGIAPFHADELPGASVTPDPARPSGPVEEILLEGGIQVANFFVRDTTDSGTDLAAELLAPSPVTLKADGTAEILIYHTHTSEAYSKSYTGFYYTDMETRTGDRDMSVAAVGGELKKALEAQGFGVIHDTTVNDVLYNGSYSRSWEVIRKNLEEHPTIQVTIDVHRDSMTTKEGVKYKPTVEIDGRKAAQIMFLAGCDADGSWGDFPNWRENLRLILKAQQKAQELFPGFARPLNFSNSKYNMNATPGSLLVEVGTEVTTIAEAKYAGRLLGQVLAETLKPDPSEK